MELSTWAELLMLNKLMEKEITLEVIIGEEIKETKTDLTTEQVGSNSREKPTFKLPLSLLEVFHISPQLIQLRNFSLLAEKCNLPE